jgi:hypothetical protein
MNIRDINKSKLINIPLLDCFKIFIKLCASIHILKKVYPTYYYFFESYFKNCSEHVPLSTYIYYFNYMIKNKSMEITMLNIPGILYLIHQYEVEKKKEKKLKENAIKIYDWCKEFKKKYSIED